MLVQYSEAGIYPWEPSLTEISQEEYLHMAFILDHRNAFKCGTFVFTLECISNNSLFQICALETKCAA